MVLAQILFIYKLRDANTSQFDGVEHLLGTGLADRLATEEGRHTHVATWAHEMLTGTATAALGWVTLEHLGDVRLALHGQDTDATLTGHVRPALRTHVLALLAVKLGADRRRDAQEILDVLRGTLGPAWAFVELGLGVVDGLATLSLGIVLAGGRLVNHTTLCIQKTRRGRMEGRTTAGHFLVLLHYKKIQHFQRFEHVLQVT